ncbi:MAG: transglycosylase family protein [Acidimicrobiales bacterium]|jgi:hypothetical protein
MRKHRLYGIVLAVLLGVGALTQLPNSRHNRSTSFQQSTGTRRAGTRLFATQHRLDAGRSALEKNVHLLASHAPRRPRPRSQVVGGTSLHDTEVSLVAFEIEAPAPASRPAQLPPAPPPSRLPTQRAASSSTWARLRQCESHSNYAEDTSNGYFGAYQFSLSTWKTLGLSGLPSDAPADEQDEAAQELQARSGWGQWPSCARQLGLV